MVAQSVVYDDMMSLIVFL